jgi:hypothetical protein
LIILFFFAALSLLFGLLYMRYLRLVTQLMCWATSLALGKMPKGELYIVTNPSFGDPLNTQGTLQKIIPLGAS